jgi:hypothetical protein
MHVVIHNMIVNHGKVVTHILNVNQKGFENHREIVKKPHKKYEVFFFNYTLIFIFVLQFNMYIKLQKITRSA